MKPTEEEFQQVVDEVYYENYCADEGVEWDYDKEKEWRQSLAYTEVNHKIRRGGGDSIEYHIIQHKESGKFYRAGFWYSSWDSTCHDDFAENIVEVEKKPVTREEWVKV